MRISDWSSDVCSSDLVVHSTSKATFGLRMSIGHAVVVDTGCVEVVLVSKHVEPYGIDLLTTVGIDPRRRKFVALKSRHHWRTDLGELAAAVVNCAGQGVCTSDYDALEFHRLRRQTIGHAQGRERVCPCV